MLHHVAHNNFTSYGKRSGMASSSDSIVCTDCCRKVRRGSRENGDRFTISKAAKVRPSNEGRTGTCFLGKPFWILRGVYTTEKKWHGSNKNWNGSNSFCKETENFYPFRVGSIVAYGPVVERIKVHCFFAKTIGTVPVFVGPVPFFLCRVNAPLI